MISEQNYFKHYNVVFMGSATVSIIPLKKLLYMHDNKIYLKAVVTQPAKPAGRNQKLRDPPLAQFAKAQNILTLQPLKASSVEFLSTLSDLSPDLVITAAYGQILSEEFLKIPKRGVINIHPSYLPQYRGATPVQSVIIDGLKKTGVSILFTIKELDAGPIIIQQEVDILADETAIELEERLFNIGAELLEQALDKLINPMFKGLAQDNSKASFCYKIKKEDGLINFTQERTDVIYNKYRAFKGWPKVFCFFNDKRIILEKLSLVHILNLDLKPSQAFWMKDFNLIVVGCADSSNTNKYIGIEILMPEGKKLMHAKEFWNGLKNPKDIYFSSF